MWNHTAFRVAATIAIAHDAWNDTDVPTEREKLKSFRPRIRCAAEGLDYTVAMDTTTAVTEGLKEIEKTRKPSRESLGWSFGIFNRSFEKATNTYARICGSLIRKWGIRVLLLACITAGAALFTDQLQAKLLVQQAQAQTTTLENSIAQRENQISILLGRNPGEIPRGLDLAAEPNLPEVPVGLPSMLLERRPDVRQAQAAHIAANANVGVAKATFFPQYPMTASFGVSSTSLLSFASGPTSAWSIAATAAQPLYEGGRIRSNYRLAWAQRDAAELTYKQTVKQALGDVADTLVGYTKSRTYRMKVEEQSATYAEPARLANDRYRGGATGFLEVLTTQQQYLTSELQRSQARADELQYYVRLYQALGGGWQL